MNILIKVRKKEREKEGRKEGRKERKISLMLRPGETYS
jgi:hypothetical protein